MVRIFSSPFLVVWCFELKVSKIDTSRFARCAECGCNNQNDLGIDVYQIAAGQTCIYLCDRCACGLASGINYVYAKQQEKRTEG